jgi:hypothetical protein
VAALLQGAWRAEPEPTSLGVEALGGLSPALERGGVAGLAWNRVRRRPELAASPAGARLLGQFRHQALQRALHEQALLEALRRLDQVGEAAILAKGWAASRLYPTAGFRPCGDIDLYVGVEGHARAFAALAGGRPLPVDLHRGLADLSDRDAKGVWSRTRIVAPGVRVPGAEDELRLLSLHMLRHGASRPLWLCDVAAAIEARPDAFDWGWFLSGSPRRTEAALVGLHLAGQLLGARLEGVPPMRCPRWVAAATLRAWQGPYRREPFLSQVRRAPARALREHWPGPIEATLATAGRFDAWPRLPRQLAYAAARMLRGARRSVARRRTAPPPRPPRLAELRGR